VLLTSAKGKTFDQKKARELALKDELVIIAGHYEGIDYRIEEKTDELISIGDYILTGGELPSMVISDAITRLLDGVISDDSTVEESFENSLLEYPQYTRPYEYEGKSVPDVLLSGHHDNIRKYRLKESLRMTYLHRPDLLEKVELDKEKKELLEQIISEYVNK
ncbi:MAG: tRNA (guanosine(37)-N1)-methyltransferase TrmD, partial [Erysipelotrichaceae bacterium]|nr:tRNA (guanosine(37)-N1)-methyltransferase TrmD [Erysipelotrichaceae bacterium]